MKGRWTREEHLMFIKGLDMYGKGWKKIAGLIKTRTVVQIRTHAQKYFLKLTKARQHVDSNGGGGSVDGKMTSSGSRKVCMFLYSYHNILLIRLLLSLLLSANKTTRG